MTFKGHFQPELFYGSMILYWSLFCS